MKPKKDTTVRMSRALRDIILDASDRDLREALAGGTEDFDSLAAEGRAVVERALASAEATADLPDLHKGLGVLVRMLRRREQLSPEKLAAEARIDVGELRRIELDPTFDPNPRTIFQLEKYFKLPPRILVVLSGAVRVSEQVREEAVRFAANSENISEISREEQKLLNRFVRFLQEHTD